MTDAGTVLTVGALRAEIARMRAMANDLEARLEGKSDEEALPSIPYPIPVLNDVPPQDVAVCSPRRR